MGGETDSLGRGEADYGDADLGARSFPARSSLLPILNEKPYTILCKNIFNRPFWHQWVEKMPSKVRFLSKRALSNPFLRLHVMFFKGEVGDKIFLEGGYRPILQTDNLL